MSMIVFITHCWRRLLRPFERAYWLALLLVGLSAQALAGVELDQLRVGRHEQGVLVHAHLKLDLGQAVEDALMKGVAVHFVAEAELMRDRWYWYDRKVAQVSRYYRLAYQPLTRQWRLQVSTEPIGVGGVASSLAQTFDSLQSALDVIRLQSSWKLGEAARGETAAGVWRKQYEITRTCGPRIKFKNPQIGEQRRCWACTIPLPSARPCC